MQMAEIGPGVAGGNNRQTLTDDDAKGRALFKTWCDEAGLTMGVDRDGHHVHAPRGHRPGCAAGLCRLRTSTPSRPAAAMTACSACSRALEARAHPERPRHQDQAPDRRHQLDQRGGRALRPGHARLRRLRRRPYAGLRLWPQGPGGQDLRRRAEAHRLAGRRGGRRAQDARLFRVSHRAGPDPRGREQADRRRHPRPGPVVAGVHADRQGGAHRLDADGDARQCRPRHGPHPRDGADGRDGQPAGRRRRRRPDVLLAEFAQRPSRQGRLHRRHPLARPGQARRHARAHRGGSAEDLRGARRRLRRSSRSAISIRSPSIPCWSTACARPPSGSATATWTSSPAPVTTPAGRRKVAPTTMVMCPCVDGLSHNEDENRSRTEWATAGADVLLHAVLETAEIVR